jgi:hypothetical protein
MSTGRRRFRIDVFPLTPALSRGGRGRRALTPAFFRDDFPLTPALSREGRGRTVLTPALFCTGRGGNSCC